MWNRIRQQYQPLIEERSKSIDHLLEQWCTTGDPYFKKLADDQIAAQISMKEHIIKLEKEHGLTDQAE